MPCFSDLEVKERVEQGRIIVVNADKVYDVTDFADRHPGGKHYLLDNAGEDVTSRMCDESPHQHTTAAYTILNKYYIGQLKNPQGTSKLKRRAVNGSVENGSVENGSVENGSIKNGGPHHKDVSEMEQLVDWDKPMLSQLHKLGDRYYDWVHHPEDKHIRLFHSDFCEYFSACPWYVIPIYWIPILLMFLYMSYKSLSESQCVFPASSNYGVHITPGYMPLLFLAGLISWTLIEYVLHRWLFHLRPPSNSILLVTAHFLLHGQHHKTPLDKERLVFPPVPATIMGIILYMLYATVVPHAITQSLAAGIVTGYIAYDLTHYFLHHGRPTLPYFVSLKKYHVKHHFEQQQLGFGISSKLWDYPFGTLIRDC